MSFKGMFMNEDIGFDAEESRTICNDREIEANIADNTHNKIVASKQYQYFDEQL